jgi:hypothetical protein
MSKVMEVIGGLALGWCYGVRIDAAIKALRDLLRWLA